MNEQSPGSLSNEQIADYIFSDLEAGQEQYIEDFLSQHEEYATAIDGLLDYCTASNMTKDDLLRHLNHQSFQSRYIDIQENVHKVRKRYVAISMAASLVFLIISIIALSLLIHTTKENARLLSDAGRLRDTLTYRPGNIEEKTQVEFHKKDSLLIAANLAGDANLPDAALERRRDQFLTERGGDANVVSPMPEQQFGLKSNVIFKWESPQAPASLTIVNNKDSIVFQELNPASPVTAPALQPGLYYWMLESKRDMLYIDRFIVRTR